MDQANQTQMPTRRTTMARPHTEPTTALTNLIAAYDAFVLAGGMALDRSNRVGIGYLRLLEIEREISGRAARRTNATPARMPARPAPVHHGNR
jgi:hypothetical protein